VKPLLPLAKELGTTLNKLAIAWCLKNPHVSTVILGASRIEQLQDNLKALDVVPLLTEEVMEKIEGILQNKPALT
jgi:aryl-alcohol dehydrogenase-like predicted oxidoreductase